MSVERIRELAEEILVACDDPPAAMYDVHVSEEMSVYARDVWPGDYVYKTGAWRRVQGVNKLSAPGGHQVCITYHGNITAQYLRPNEILRKRVR